MVDNLKETTTLTLKQVQDCIKKLKDNRDKRFRGYNLWVEDKKIYSQRCDKYGKTYGEKLNITEYMPFRTNNGV